MSVDFNQLEQGYEAKFKLDEEQRFKAEAKRNKLLGLWVAEKFGLTGEAAQRYAITVVDADLEEPGIADVVRKVLKDAEARNVAISEEDIKTQLDVCYVQALKDLEGEFPMPLGNDHKPIGG